MSLSCTVCEIYRDIDWKSPLLTYPNSIWHSRWVMLLEFRRFSVGWQKIESLPFVWRFLFLFLIVCLLVDLFIILFIYFNNFVTVTSIVWPSSSSPSPANPIPRHVIAKCWTKQKVKVLFRLAYYYHVLPEPVFIAIMRDPTPPTALFEDSK